MTKYSDHLKIDGSIESCHKRFVIGHIEVIINKIKFLSLGKKADATKEKEYYNTLQEIYNNQLETNLNSETKSTINELNNIINGSESRTIQLLKDSIISNIKQANSINTKLGLTEKVISEEMEENDPELLVFFQNTAKEVLGKIINHNKGILGEKFTNPDISSSTITNSKKTTSPEKLEHSSDEDKTPPSTEIPTHISSNISDSSTNVSAASTPDELPADVKPEHAAFHYKVVGKLEQKINEQKQAREDAEKRAKQEKERADTLQAKLEAIENPSKSPNPDANKSEPAINISDKTHNI